MSEFRNGFGEAIFKQKYAHGPGDTWASLAERLVLDVCGKRSLTDQQLLSNDEMGQLEQYIREFKFLPGGRYLYYAGRPAHFFNNCYLLRAEEDTREEWGALTKRSMDCLMSGGGIGVDYSILRPEGSPLSRTGGLASGPIPLMYAINEIGRNVMQGGSRRSAIYASLNWQHGDIDKFLHVKNWHEMKLPGYESTVWDAKQADFNYPAPLDMTNISVNYDDAFLLDMAEKGESGRAWQVFRENVRQAMMTGEPGFSFNFGSKQNETLRNAPVSADTRVLTKSGYVRVGDIVDRPVVVWTGFRWAETVFKKTGSNVPTLEVVLSNGKNIRCSEEHPFIVWTPVDNVRVAAANLKPGDAIDSTLPVEPIESGIDFYGLGFVFGDGSIRNGRGEISYHTPEKAGCFAVACEQLGARAVGVPNRAYFKTEYSSKKFIPSTGFVAGWFDADGSYVRDILRLSCKDKDALLELSEVLNEWGIKNSVRLDGHSNYAPNNSMYTLTVFKSSFARFAELIPTLRLKIKVPKRAIRAQNILVKEVRQSGITEDVFCCDVGVPEHSFMAEGVLVSNCTEVTSEDDSDVCNLGSVNMGNIQNLEEFRDVVRLASKFLVCGTIRADLPYEKVYEVRARNRRLGLGLMGIHEWLLKRGYKYEVVDELHQWLAVYRDDSERSANEHCDRLYLSRPVAYRAIAPTGSIGILAGTTTGIEPLFAVAYKRRYLKDGTKWHYQYVVDSAAEELISSLGINPDEIETALDLANDYERRIKFQADVQDYVDMSISSTINLPVWGSATNNDENVDRFAAILARYCTRLRGFTCYPDGSRGGQPLVSVPYADAMKHRNVEFLEHDICSITGHGGSCGV